MSNAAGKNGLLPLYIREDIIRAENLVMVNLKNIYGYDKLVKIERVWVMPNKCTFQIKPIKELIEKYKGTVNMANVVWIDPFPFEYKEDALKMLSRYESSAVDGVLFDPPYSPRQLKECYKNIGQTLTDTKSSVWSKWKDEIARVIKPNGLCISFGWNTNGLGKNRGFKIIKILLVAHGGNHNDTIVTVEKKINHIVADFYSATPSLS